MHQATEYPKTAYARSKWIRELRKSVKRPNIDSKPNILLEEELGPNGDLLQTGIIFLMNRECPWTCVMCDLWQHTSVTPMPPGHARTQLKSAINQMELATEQPFQQIKIYNSGSFFDTKAIYTSDYGMIAESLSGYDRIIVENHPKLLGQHVSAFNGMLKPQLEIAMGLEVANDAVLDKLNKRFSLDDYKHACDFFHAQTIDHRTFIMVQPPFTHQAETLDQCQKSVQFAFDHQASCVSLIPSRATTGAMHALIKQGDFIQPSIRTLESCFTNALRLNRGRVFVDLWDLEIFSECDACFPLRRARLVQMNRSQTTLPAIHCQKCQQ
jgi:radical SAM enzyme (TIGR01210 family)